VALADLAPALAGRPCEAHALRYVPRYPSAPPMLPPQMLAAANLS